jgi:hypothetical protein
MHQNVGERLRHANDYSASLQPAPVTATTSRSDHSAPHRKRNLRTAQPIRRKL